MTLEHLGEVHSGVHRGPIAKETWEAAERLEVVRGCVVQWVWLGLSGSYCAECNYILECVAKQVLDSIPVTVFHLVHTQTSIVVLSAVGCLESSGKHLLCCAHLSAGVHPGQGHGVGHQVLLHPPAAAGGEGGVEAQPAAAAPVHT